MMKRKAKGADQMRGRPKMISQATHRTIRVVDGDSRTHRNICRRDRMKMAEKAEFRRTSSDRDWKMRTMFESSESTQRRRCRKNSVKDSGQWVEFLQLSMYSSFHPCIIISVHSHRSSPAEDTRNYRGDGGDVKWDSTFPFNIIARACVLAYVRACVYMCVCISLLQARTNAGLIVLGYHR